MPRPMCPLPRNVYVQHFGIFISNPTICIVLVELQKFSLLEMLQLLKDLSVKRNSLTILFILKIKITANVVQALEHPKV